jgi:hypothetical protein
MNTVVVLRDNLFKTPLGNVTCGMTTSEGYFEITAEASYEHGHSQTISTRSHQIEFITFKLRLPLYNDEMVADSMGWLWRISKYSTSDESIQLYCKLIDYKKSIEAGSQPGEHLDAVAFSDKNWVLHIGTEDGEIMHSRALQEDGMPLRFKEDLSFHSSFHKLERNGFNTPIPKLNQGERIHLHYLSAFDRRKTESVNTWLAVDSFKRELENWIGIW